MQNSSKTNSGSKVFRVACNPEQRPGSASKQQTVEQSLILQGQWAELARQGKHEMEVGHIQQLFTLLIQPIGLFLLLAFRAVTAMASQCSGSACHQIVDDLALGE